MDLLLENINHEDLKKYLKEFYNYAKKELNLDKPPRLLLKRDQENADYMFGKTGYYSPESYEICLYVTDRHAKDIIRSFAHELVHHMQNLQGKNDDIDLADTSDPAYASKNPQLRELEREAFERGNMIFRDWCDIHKVKGNNIMNEVTKKQKNLEKKLEKSAAETYGAKGKKKKSIAHAIKTNIEKGKKYQGPGKPMAEKEEIKKLANEEAKLNMDAITGKDMKDVKESKEQVNIPYPELYKQKERLLADKFNEREETIYQELIRRFIKK